MNVNFFDVRSYLSEVGIPYQTEGKNVTSGWVEIRCPYCSDSSFHLGISPIFLFHCWRCGAKGHILKLIQELENCSSREAKARIGQFQDFSLIPAQEEPVYSTTVKLPLESHVQFTSHHLDYLRQRNFDPNHIVAKYKLRVCNHLGKYKFRFIIPVFMNGSLVNFTALDYTRKQNPPYLHCENKNSVIPMKQCLYNVDSVSDTALIVEGVTDVWRMGDGAVAIMGIEWTDDQILFLSSLELKKAVVFFDSDAIDKSHQFASEISAFIPNVEVHELPEGDPADLTYKQVEEIRTEVFGNDKEQDKDLSIRSSSRRIFRGY